MPGSSTRRGSPRGPSLRLELADRTGGAYPVDTVRLRRTLEGAFRGRLVGTFSLALVDDAAIEELHLRFLGRDGPTDVLAFPLEEEGASPADPEPVAGEVVISVERAASEAEARGLPLQEEVLRYCVHGFLHLLGYDDQSGLEARRMRREQERIVRSGAGHD